MLDTFAFHFLLCNAYLALLIVILYVLKYVLRHHLSQHVQYMLWYPFFLLLLVPFLPASIGTIRLPFYYLHTLTTLPELNIMGNEGLSLSTPAEALQLQDFAVSVANTFSPHTLQLWNYVLFSLWLIGVSCMLLFTLYSRSKLFHIVNTALPVQHKEACSLLLDCRHTLHINYPVSFYTTDLLTSPVSVGVLRPRIYLPVSLLINYQEKELRYILLHELLHYKHKDAFANHLMNLAGILYWFNPLIHFAIRSMKNDREVACDSAVLSLLKENDYIDYGNVLLHFAEKTIAPVSYTIGIGGSHKQLKKRIFNIVSYRKASLLLKCKSGLIFSVVLLFLFTCIPQLSLKAAVDDTYQFTATQVTYENLSAYFPSYEGSFVLYDEASDSWNIYQKENSCHRSSPNSTFKIYSGLLGLEHQVITPSDSALVWDGTVYPFDAWNQNQTLNSAMQASVNWYFQELDSKTGIKQLNSDIHTLHYGNEDLSGGINRYWLESSLKISPIEQVEQLHALHHNTAGYSPANLTALQNSLLLDRQGDTVLYGKTGTGRINDQDVNGWFIGYVTTPSNTYYFATNIQAASNASGTAAAKIALSILADKAIYSSVPN